jgi:hypothetical protein
VIKQTNYDNNTQKIEKNFLKAALLPLNQKIVFPLRGRLNWGKISLIRLLQYIAIMKRECESTEINA